jgi:N-terminal domain of toast_rack, DUF2154
MMLFYGGKNMKRPLLTVMIIILLATLACTTSINVPTIKTGSTQTIPINEPVSGVKDAQITIGMGAGTLSLSGGADGLVDGDIKYNVVEWKPTVTRNGNKLDISQEKITGFSGIPSSDVINDWTFKLNNVIPLDLIVNAGAYKGKLDLSGLRLTNLEINDGASETTVTFDSLNPVTMDTLAYKTGASKVELDGLANANFTAMTFEGGAGDYHLDFTGTLKQDASVTVKTGISNLTIIIPAGMVAKITNQGALNNITTQGIWTLDGSTYTTSGEGPTLTIDLQVGVGNLTLTHQK